MQFCCKRPSETVLLLCRAATLLTDFSSVLGSSSSSRLIRQRGVRAEQMIILVCLQVAVSGFSLKSTRLQERVFSRDSKDLFAVVGLEQIQKHPLLVIKTRLKMWILIFKLRELDSFCFLYIFEQEFEKKFKTNFSWFYLVSAVLIEIHFRHKRIEK